MIYSPIAFLIVSTNPFATLRTLTAMPNCGAAGDEVTPIEGDDCVCGRLPRARYWVRFVEGGFADLILLFRPRPLPRALSR